MLIDLDIMTKDGMIKSGRAVALIVSSKSSPMTPIRIGVGMTYACKVWCPKCVGLIACIRCLWCVLAHIHPIHTVGGWVDGCMSHINQARVHFETNTHF